MKITNHYILTIVTIFFFSANVLLGQSSTNQKQNTKTDTITTKQSKDIEELKLENKILRERIDILNSTNDRILNSVYWTIGAILTALFGLTVWNGIKNRNLDEEKFKIVLENSKKELFVVVHDNIEVAIGSKRFDDLKNTEENIRQLKKDIRDLKYDYFARELKFHPFNSSSYDDYGLLKDFIDFVINNKLKSYYGSLFETIKNYLTADEYFSYSDKVKILTLFEAEDLDPKHKFIVDDIKNLLDNIK